MLTRMMIRNFKRFDEVTIDLDQTVVFIGPNNSGKTTALQALALWDLGIRRWQEKRPGKSQGKGVTINRRDLMTIPVPVANILWRDRHVRTQERQEGKQSTQNIRIDIMVAGITGGKEWSQGLEFDYANAESFYCRPLRSEDGAPPPGWTLPMQASQTRVSFLPPMSGLAEREFIKQTGEIDVLIGQGQTAQVLRNLCYQICYPDEKQPPSPQWQLLAEHIRQLFGVTLQLPIKIAERSEIILEYKEKSNVVLDISSSGRGLQQTLLILCHIYKNPETVLLLDEPDAHLEVLRQRQTYQLISEMARQNNSQVIIASHSEVILNEAASRDKVVAFLGKPHIINNRNSQVIKALNDYGWDQYALAEQKGWVLYLEDRSDLDILRQFADLLNHPAKSCLKIPFFRPISNNLPSKAKDHFFALKEAKSDLLGIVIFDRLGKEITPTNDFIELRWNRREIENYFCTEEVLLAWSTDEDASGEMLGALVSEDRKRAMLYAIQEVSHLLEIDDTSPWSPDVKASEEVLERIFKLFFKKLAQKVTFSKKDYWQLVKYLPPWQVDEEIIAKLDAIAATAQSATLPDKE